jgi:hypothetical protein
MEKRSFHYPTIYFSLHYRLFKVDQCAIHLYVPEYMAVPLFLSAPLSAYLNKTHLHTIARQKSTLLFQAFLIHIENAFSILSILVQLS